jgi:predicted HD phosphohydrolase
MAALSPASQQSLALQGGHMSRPGSEAFLALAHARLAITLRLADDAAKINNLKVPILDASNFRACHREVLLDGVGRDQCKRNLGGHRASAAS